MAHLVGASLVIPGDAWRPQQEHETAAQIMHFSRPTRGYPEGRVRVICDDGTDVWWDVSKLPQEWITGMPDPSAPPFIATPSRAGRRSAATTPGTTGRGRGRRRSSRVADGYDSSGAGGFSDGEGGQAVLRLSTKLIIPKEPAITTATVTVTSEAADAGAEGALSDGGPEPPKTGVQCRGRPRKSLRFAPGTISPGANAGAAASVAGLFTPDVAPAVDLANGTAVFTSPLKSPRPSDGGNAGAEEFAAAAGKSSTPPRLSWEQRARNTMLMVLVTLPAIYFYRQLHFGCSDDKIMRPLSAVWHGDLAALTTSDFWCAVGYQEPLLAVNLVFLLNVDILFWFVGLLQGSAWLIDPFWTIAPIMIGLFYQHHPAATSQPLRSRLAMGLLWLWSVRLTHSYFRREEWQVGAREDWRYARMAHRMGRARWAVVSFFAVGIVQHLMLVGITLPLLAIHTSVVAWNPVVDTCIFLAAATGIMTSLVADNQLRDFMLINEKRAKAGRPRLLLLDTGLWAYSRHPNFFGEQLWWWSLAMWAVMCGQSWMVVGTLFNTLCFIPITRLTEERMLERPERANFYRHYQQTTSVWVPWFRRAVMS